MSLLKWLLIGVVLALGGCRDSNEADPLQGSVGGTVNGLSGRVTLSNGSESLQVAANGAFTFPTKLASGASYSVIVTAQPASQTCSVVNGSGRVTSTLSNDALVTCVTHTHALGGTVSGLAGTLGLQNNGGEIVTLDSVGGFVFPTAVAESSAYAVTVNSQPAGATCVVSHGTGIVGAADVSNIAVTCEANTHIVSGNISGLIGDVSLQNNGADTLNTQTDGPFSFATPVAEGAPYLVLVSTQPPAQTCSVSNGAGTMGVADVSDVTVVCSTNTFDVGGTVSGLVGSVIVENNGGDTFSINGDGLFTFPTPVAQGGTYNVTVQTQPASQTCSVSNGSGTIGAGDISSVSIICSTNTFTVGGTLSGLSGSVQLQNNGGDTQTLNSNGSFTFSTPVAEGSPYSVTVSTQPTTQTCAVTNGSGTLGASNVTNVGVTCVDNTTTLSVSATGSIPVNSGSGSITVTNTGLATAYNVSATLPGGWTAVTQDASNCVAIPPSGSCTLSFTTTAPYVAQDNIALTGDNIDSPPTLAIAFTIDGWLVFSVDSASLASVIQSADQFSIWESNYNVTLGALSLIDGAANTATVMVIDPPNGSAARQCHYSTAGGASTGTWYLPAVCQLASSSSAASCPNGVPNIHSNLARLGFGGFGSGTYWSSTEPASPGYAAWAVVPSSDTASVTTKMLQQYVRCARSISY